MRTYAASANHTSLMGGYTSYESTGYQGEEFLLILPATGHKQGTALAERLRGTLCLQSIALSSKANVNLTASFCVASVAFEAQVPDFKLDNVISVADELLYEAKREGRNRVRFVQLPMKVPTLTPPNPL